MESEPLGKIVMTGKPPLFSQVLTAAFTVCCGS